MDHAKQAFKTHEKKADGIILALSWNIATEPNLYKKLALNPYASYAKQIISERFPDTSPADIVLAVILAEPEGKYDRNFCELSETRQKEELLRQTDTTTQIDQRLTQYCNKHKSELSLLSHEITYYGLSIVIFGTIDLQEIELNYSQSQRRDFKLSIISFINNISSSPSSGAKHKMLQHPLLQVVCGVLSVILLSSFTYELYISHIEQDSQHIAAKPKATRQVLGVEAVKDRELSPVRLRIPSINVDAVIETMGLTAEGAMDVPRNTIEVGWYQFGPNPGEMGNAVISGHFDGREGKIGVFNNLDKLKQGDKLYVLNEQGTTTTFVVRKTSTYSPGFADEVFVSHDTTSHLNLVTCNGAWNSVQKSYNRRLVVFADVIP